jgi:predicted  nucleic acid-binding Zn-ribbon protein
MKTMAEVRDARLHHCPGCGGWLYWNEKCTICPPESAQ